jgi:hypothetical protein
MYSIHIQEANDAQWLEMRSLELEKQLKNLQKSGRSVISVYEFTTQRSSMARWEETRGSR